MAEMNQAQREEALARREALLAQREAQLEKVPYMLVVGEKEVADHTVAVRSRGAGDQGAMSMDALLDRLHKEIEEKSL